MGRRSYSHVNTDAPLEVDFLHNSLATADYHESNQTAVLPCKSGPLRLEAILMTPRVRRFSAYVRIHENYYTVTTNRSFLGPPGSRH